MTNSTMSLTKQQLIFQIPESRKYEVLGTEYIQALNNYFAQYTSDDVDTDNLIVENFDSLILQNDYFIETLKLFAEEQLESIGISKKQSVQSIRERLISTYQINLPQPHLGYPAPVTSSNCVLPLHDFQERMRRKVVNAIFSQKRRFLIQMPTGAGKTRTACEIIIDFIRFNAANNLLNDKLKVLWVAQSTELCVQAYQTFAHLYNSKGTSPVSIGHYYGANEISETILGKPAVIFCSIQKLIRNYTTEIWQQIKEHNYLVVVDEAHRSIASQWVKALNYFTENQGVYVIGLTATPGSSDLNTTHELSSYYHSNKISLMDEFYSEIPHPISYLTNLRFLAEIERYEIQSNVLIQDAVIGTTNFEIKYTPTTIVKLALDASRNASIKNIVEENAGKKILIFSCSVEHNRILKDILRYHQFTAEIVDASSSDREHIIDRFKNGDLNILINFGVLTTGFDAPNTDVCIIARPVNSIVMYSQMVGRILRGARNIPQWSSDRNKTNKLYTIKDNLNHGDYDALYNSFNDFWN